jgi:hypothetical protein
MIDEHGSGAWCWFQHPRCVTDGEYTYAGWVEAGGAITLAQYDHERRQWVYNREIDTIDDDDHGSPALHVRSDGRVLVIYMEHNDDRFRYRTSAPQDVTTLGAVDSFAIDGGGGNYPQFFDPASEDRLYLFHRACGDGESRNWFYRHSTDEGRSWSEQREVIQFPGDYSLYARVSTDGRNRTDVAVTPHPRPNPAGLYHGYFDASSQQWHRSDGTRLSPPFTYTDLTCVWDVEARQRDAWIWDVRTNGETPVVLFTTIDQDDLQDHRYEYASFEDGAWEVHSIVETHQLVARNANIPEDHYSPGLVFDHQTPGDLLVSRSVGERSHPESDTRRGVELERWRVSEGEERFEPVEAITADSETNQFRPVTPVPSEPGVESPIEVLWMYDQDGQIYTFDDFTTAIRSSATE